MIPARPLILLPVACLAACASTPSAPLTVEVRGKDDQPIRGAYVQVAPANPRHPLRIGDLFASDLDPNEWVRTDSNGRAVTSAYKGVPTNLVIAAMGFAPCSLFFSDHPAANGPTGWLAADPGGDPDAPMLKVRCLP